MSVLSSIFLGLVQGVAEFLPISSSGHLSLFQNFFGLVSAEGSLFFDVLLHLGTLIAVFVYYWKDIVALVKEFFHLIACVFSREKRRQMKRLPPNGRLILMIIVATLPLFVILPIKDKVEGLYGNTIFVGCALAVTGCILFFSDRMARGKKGPKSELWAAKNSSSVAASGKMFIIASFQVFSLLYFVGFQAYEATL